MDLKMYSFGLDKKKHLELIVWIKEQQEEGDLNFSGLIRKLLKEEIERRTKKC